MTNDSLPPKPPERQADAGTDDRPPAPRRRRRWPRVLAWTSLGVVVLVVLVLASTALALYGAVTTERGTRLLWRSAVELSGGRLSGALEGGTLASGVRLADVRWLSGTGVDTTDIRIDRLRGRWALTRAPWRFTVDELRIGTIDARLAPSRKSAPMRLPGNLRLPLELDVHALEVDQVLVRSGTSVSEYDRLRFHGTSDGRHHHAILDSLDTPFGSITADLSLDGARPFPLHGDATWDGKLQKESAHAHAQVSGTLEAPVADVNASGMQLAGHAHIEAAPFADVLLKRMTLSFEHVNPQLFAAGAPYADLSLAAELVPVTQSGAFVVAGPVSIVNAAPGEIGAHRLPLIDAQAQVRLDAQAQHIENLHVRLVKSATVTGKGTLTNGRGQLDFRVAGLDLSTVTPLVRPTALGGAINISLEGATQSLALDLTDVRAPLRARAHLSLDRTRIALSEFRADAGKGSIELKGTLERDAKSTFDVSAKLADFDPGLVLAMPPASARTARTAPSGQTAKGAAGAAASAPTAAPVARAASSSSSKSPQSAAVAKAWPQARITGTLSATGALAPSLAAKVRFALANSVYDGLPLTGKGAIELAGSRLLPSDATVSIAGNDIDLHGSFGAPGDRLRFHIDAPQLERLGFGLAGAAKADGNLTGSLAQPEVALTYDARGIAIGENRIGSAVGRAQIGNGATGALEFLADARDVHTSAVDLATLTVHLAGTRARHTLDATATGTLRGRPLNLTLAARGGLSDTGEGPRWDGTVARLANRGTPAIELQTPLTVSAAREHVTLGPTRIALEGAALELKSFAYDHGTLRSAGSAANVSVGRLIAIEQQITGQPSKVASDLILSGDWNFSVGNTASGYARIERESGDVSLGAGHGVTPLGITALAARAEFNGGRRLELTAHAVASRIGKLDASVNVPLAPDVARGGQLGVAEDEPLAGSIAADVPSLKTMGGLLGPTYLLDGHLALNLSVAGTAAKPNVSGSLTGDGISATLVDLGLQLKNGVVRIALSENLVDFQNVEFHGGDGTLRATGRIRLDSAEPDLSAQIVADKLELFAAPDRQLSLSGSATVANAGPAGGMNINGKFKIDRARFDTPDLPAPHLSDDVVIVRNNDVSPDTTQQLEATKKPVSRFTPRAQIDIDFGQDFRYRGQGADLGLRGVVTVLSSPGEPLRATGNVRVSEGSSYTTFGTKLAIENGFFTFNGPVANPGINILAMRRNQQVEAGVQVTGTVQAPTVKLVSEPNVPDNEKLSWLLFGHGTDQGNNLGQQSSMTTALALLGSATGKRVAQTVGLDEFSVGRSDVGLTDAQVVKISKAINERLVLGYEQGLQSADNAFKATVSLTRFWSVALYTGTFQGVDINYTRRFDRWFGSGR